MCRIEESFRSGLVVLVEDYVGMTDYKRVETKVEWCMGGCILRGKGVNKELTIHLGFGIIPVQTYPCSEELGRGY